MQATTGSKSFIEVLEAEIRSDLRREIEAEVQAKYGLGVVATAAPAEQAPSAAVHAATRLEMWLASNVGPITFASPKAARKVYGTPSNSKMKTAATSTDSTPIRSAILFTVVASEDYIALEVLNRQSDLKLAPTFTETELKAVWRKAALKSHPDRFAGADEITKLRMAALFRELAEAYARLTSLIETAKSRAA